MLVPKNALDHIRQRCADAEPFAACRVTEDALEVEGFTLRSRRLAQTIAGCDRVCIFGATLGFQCDRLLRTYSVDGIARGAVIQAVLASKIEEVCDGIENRLRAQGLTLRQR